MSDKPPISITRKSHGWKVTTNFHLIPLDQYERMVQAVAKVLFQSEVRQARERKAKDETQD